MTVALTMLKMNNVSAKLRKRVNTFVKYMGRLFKEEATLSNINLYIQESFHLDVTSVRSVLKEKATLKFISDCIPRCFHSNVTCVWGFSIKNTALQFTSSHMSASVPMGVKHVGSVLEQNMSWNDISASFTWRRVSSASFAWDVFIRVRQTAPS